MKIIGLAALSAIAALSYPGMALATELEPNEFVTAPPGTTALIGYFVYGDNQSYKPVGAPNITQNTHLNETVGIARAAEYFNIGHVEALVEFLQPFGQLSNAKIGGVGYPSSSGIGDTTFALAIWPVNDKASRTYLGLTLYVVVPDGAYTHGKTINLGGNRFVYDPEIAFHKGFDDKWSVDVSADVIEYGQNTNAGSTPVGQTLSQEATVQLQAFANYAWAGRVVTSLGYEGESGGRQSLAGIATTGKTDFTEIRLVNSYAVTPALQVLGEVNHQFSNTGGFRQQIGVTLRTLYAF
jgi:hypothetical protein